MSVARYQIQYVSSADATTLAYAVQGDGMPFVLLPPIASHLDLAWEIDILRATFEWIAARFRLVCMDYRGTGLSQRGAVSRSLDLSVQDLDAVLSKVGAEPCVLYGIGTSAMMALAFAHRFPSRVARLILYNPAAKTADWRGMAGLAEVLALADRNWELFTEMVASLLHGFSPEVARQQAAVLRAALTPEEFKAIALEEADVTALLPEIATPSLIMYAREAYVAMQESARRIAATLRNARVVTISGKAAARGFNDPEIAGPVAEFLGVSTATASAPAARQGTAVILFADIADSTALTESMGDAGFRAKARDLDEALRKIIRETGGTAIDGKLLGDGVLAVFSSAAQAIDAARRCLAASGSGGLQLHLGIHAGDVIREATNVYGGAVNIAARIAAASAPGEILVSDTVRNLARTSAGATFDDRGEHRLKGVAEPVRLFAVQSRIHCDRRSGIDQPS